MTDRKALYIEEGVDQYIESQGLKERHQIWRSIFRLGSDPRPQDSKELKGFKPFRRTDVGQHRIIYLIIENVVKVVVVGSRNDDDVYKQFRRKVKNFSFAA